MNSMPMFVLLSSPASECHEVALQLQHRHEPGRDAVLVVDSATAVDVAAFARRAERRVPPLRRVDVDGIRVRHDEQRPFAAVTREPRDDVRPVRLERKHLHRDALGFEHLYQVVGGGLLVARRARRVHAHERLEVPQRFGLDAGRPALRLRARAGGCETEQQCDGDPYFDRHGSFRRSACARRALRYRERRGARQRYPRT
jgi:hypothetical protein